MNQEDFAVLAGVSQGMVSQWLSGARPVSPEKCVLIEASTKGELTRKDLRPDDWKLYWPELVGKKAA